MASPKSAATETTSIFSVNYTVENQPVQFTEKIEVVSVAALFGEAIKRIHNRESISEMFE